MAEDRFVDQRSLEEAWAAAKLILESPLAALVVALIFSGIALSGRLSVRGARWVLLLAWVVAALALRQLPAAQLALSLGAIALLLVALAVWMRPEVVPQYFGELIPRRRLLFSSIASPASSQIEIGDSGTVFSWGGPQGKPMFNFFGSELTVERIGGRLKVSTTIKDKQGHVVAELVRNAWKVAPPPKTWDRNYSKDALEVKDAAGNIVLQVQALPDRIRLQGEWWGDAVHGVRLVKSDDSAYPGAMIVFFGPKQRPAGAPNIVPMFKYPSHKYFGKPA